MPIDEKSNDSKVLEFTDKDKAFGFSDENIKSHRLGKQVLHEINSTEQTYSNAITYLAEQNSSLIEAYDKVTPNEDALTKNDFSALMSQLRSLKNAQTVLTAVLLESDLQKVNPAAWVESLQKVQTAYTDYAILFDKLKAKSLPTEIDEVFNSLKIRDNNPSLENINSVLIMPIQRLPRYIMLSGELAKHMDESNPNAQAIQEFKKVAINLAVEVNTAMAVSAAEAAETKSVDAKPADPQFPMLLQSYLGNIVVAITGILWGNLTSQPLIEKADPLTPLCLQRKRKGTITHIQDDRNIQTPALYEKAAVESSTESEKENNTPNQLYKRTRIR